MAHDHPLPEKLQLLRIGLGGSDDLAIFAYDLRPHGDSPALPCFCLAPMSADPETMDVTDAIEQTFHDLLDYGGTSDDIRQILGLVPLNERGELPFEIGYGWGIPGEILNVEKTAVPSDDLTHQQILNIQSAFDNLPGRCCLPAAKIMADNELDTRQAHTVCAALREGCPLKAIEAVAKAATDQAHQDGRLDHRKMRQLFQIAARTGAQSDIFKECLADPFASAEKLHAIGHLITASEINHVDFSLAWLKLDAPQISELTYGISLGIPQNILERIGSGDYPHAIMVYITLAVSDEMEPARLSRLMDPSFTGRQLPWVYRALNTSWLTDEQLDFLCDPEMPAALMGSAYYGLVLRKLDFDVVKRYAIPDFTPKQLSIIFDAAASPKITQAGLDVLADPKITPEQMQSLACDLEIGISPLQTARLKGQMLQVNYFASEKSAGRRLGSAAEELRQTARQLHHDHQDERKVEDPEL